MSSFKVTQDEVKVLRGIQAKLHGQANEMGWHQKQREIGTLIALMHSELSEALEGARKNLMDDHLPNRQMIEVEFADCVIRILDTAGLLGLDVAGALAEKHDYNAVREDHQLHNRATENGKKFQWIQKKKIRLERYATKICWSLAFGVGLGFIVGPSGEYHLVLLLENPRPGPGADITFIPGTAHTVMN